MDKLNFPFNWERKKLPILVDQFFVTFTWFTLVALAVASYTRLQGLMYKFCIPFTSFPDYYSCTSRVRERNESVTVLLCGTSGCGKSTLSALLVGFLMQLFFTAIFAVQKWLKKVFTFMLPMLLFHSIQVMKPLFSLCMFCLVSILFGLNQNSWQHGFHFCFWGSRSSGAWEFDRHCYHSSFDIWYTDMWN